MESSQIVTMHIQSVDQNKAIKSIKHTITELDRSKIEEQKKAVRSGYDMDIILHVSTDYLLMGSEPSKEEVKNDLLSIISELSTIAKKI